MLFMVMSVSSCGNDGIPSIVAWNLVDECDYYDSDFWRARTIHHSYDSKSRTDSATLILKAQGNYGNCSSSCDAVFQYNRSSDTWSLLSAKEWTEPSYMFNDELVGKWTVGSTLGNKDESYEFEITSVKNDKITLNYKLSKVVYGGFSGDALLELSGSTTVTYTSNTLWIAIELPEHFYAQSGPNSSNSTRLCVNLDIARGVDSAYILGLLSYVA